MMYAVHLNHFSRMLKACNCCNSAACCNEQVPYNLHAKDVLLGSSVCINDCQ